MSEAASTEEVQEPFAAFAVVELMGHRTIAGRVSEVRIAGAGFLRIEAAGREGDGAVQLVRPESVYCITPVSEEAARTAAARRHDVAPALYAIPAYVADPDEDEERDVGPHAGEPKIPF